MEHTHPTHTRTQGPARSQGHAPRSQERQCLHVLGRGREGRRLERQQDGPQSLQNPNRNAVLRKPLGVERPALRQKERYLVARLRYLRSNRAEAALQGQRHVRPVQESNKGLLSTHTQRLFRVTDRGAKIFTRGYSSSQGYLRSHTLASDCGQAYVSSSGVTARRA